MADVRNLLSHRLGGRPTRENFRTGTLTVCTMVPMRSVPHRVVALVGLDDGVFPRAGAVDGDDVLARRPMTGERDVRSEDRQLFLDAILAAQETLVIAYTGANEHTGAERPPAVPLGELIDALDTTTAAPVRDRVVVRHPLQPFDPRNHTRGELVGDRPFSFDAAALAGAVAARAERVPVPPLLPEPLPPRAMPDVSLADLQAFFAHPVRAFLRSRLDVAAPLSAEEPEDAIPITLDALDRWQVGDRILTNVLAGAEPEAAVHAERLRGDLPPGRLAETALNDVLVNVVPLVREALELQGADARAVDLDVELSPGRRLTGTVRTYGNRLVSVTYSSLAARHRLASWIDLVAISAAFPDHNWTAHALGKGKGSTSHAMAGPLDDRALGWLRDLVDIYDRGMREPLPLPVKTACAYAEACVARDRTGRDDTRFKANMRWETPRFTESPIPGEDADPAHVQVFGAHAPIDVLMTEPRPDEQWNSEPHRLGQYAWRLWQPLLEGAEQVGHR
jgi:exodeoxyribonuclease V gamma subunit